MAAAHPCGLLQPRRPQRVSQETSLLRRGQSPHTSLLVTRGTAPEAFAAHPWSASRDKGAEMKQQEARGTCLPCLQRDFCSRTQHCLSLLTAGFRHSYLLPPCHKGNECDSESLSRGSDGLSFVLLWRTASRPQMDMPCVHTALGLAGDSGPRREASLTRAAKAGPEPANQAHSAPKDSWIQGPA